LKNYQVNLITLEYTKVHGYKIDTVKLTQKFNNEYKEQIKSIINFNGQFATHLDTQYIFGSRFERFWAMFFATG
jgi:hypothetical protein